MLFDDQAIEIFKTLADTNRLQLFQLLLRSDHTNSELMERTQLSQNLLSHHLNVLSTAGLIQAHRSIGDARRHYYSANLGVVCAFGDWWSQHTYCKEEDFPVLNPRPHVLFLCLRNSVRSLMAEAIARKFASQTFDVWSAGVQPGAKVEPLMVQVLDSYGVPSDNLEPVLFNKLGKRDFDYVITVCDIVHESGYPEELHNAEYVHWSMADPMLGSPDPLKQLEDTRQLYVEITHRLRAFVQRVVQAKAVIAED